MSDLLTQLSDYGEQLDSQARPLEDLAPARVPMVGGLRRRRRRRRGWLYAVAAAVVAFALIGGVPLLLQNTPQDAEPVAPPATTPAVEGLDEALGVSVTGDVLWAWDRDGRTAAYVDGSWTGMPPLADPVVDIAGSESEAWAITTNRCDPTLSDWEAVGCETALWRLVDDAWMKLPELGGLRVPDNLQDVEIGPATRSVLILTADGILYAWDDVSGIWPFDSGLNNADAVAMTLNNEDEPTFWASRFNPFFPDDVGFSRLGEGWQAFNPLDGQNHHAVMTTTPDGDLWVWFSEFPASNSLSGTALAYYNGGSEEWTIHTSNIPLGHVRAMTASNDAVWLAVDSTNPQLWQFDSETWTLITTLQSADILDVAAASDGTIWYIEDNTVHEVQP
jgi:hypothetical protein